MGNMSQPILQFVHQQPTDLKLGLVRCDVPMTVIQQTRCEMGEWGLTFQIIGESHAVRIEKDGQHVFTEILACIPLPPESQIHAFDQLTPYHFAMKNYEIRVEFEDNASAILPAPHAECFIEAAFPVVAGRTPVTRIVWRKMENRVEWQTWHIYPTQNHGVWVKSSSSLNLTSP